MSKECGPDGSPVVAKSLAATHPTRGIRDTRDRLAGRLGVSAENRDVFVGTPSHSNQEGLSTMSSTSKTSASIVRSRWSSDLDEHRFQVHNPANGEPIAIVQGCGVAEVDAAVRAAHAAYEGDWRWRPALERGAKLLECAAVLEAHADELAQLETRENGKPFAQARFFDVNALIGTFRYFGSLIGKIPGEFHDAGSIYSSVVIEPFGVVGGIIPFNWPPIHTGGKAAPALAAGNTVVLKPGEQAPLTVMRIVELLQGVLPPDVLHVVPGHGKVAGEALAAHPLVRMLSLTGSPQTGTAVLKTAAANWTPALMELGGKNAFIVFEDADLDRAVRDAIEGGYFNQGEACTAASRFLVHTSVYEMFVERLSAGVRKLKVGDGAVQGTHVGPLVTKAHQQRVLDYIRIGREEGAVVAAEAAIPQSGALANGFFVPPTLFRDVKPSMRIAREEIFGPVSVVIPFASFEEALQIANDTDFGLVAAVYTGSNEKGFRAARRLDTGVVFLNNYFRGFLGTPFGGTKASGYGRESAMQTLKEYGRLKTIRFPSGEGQPPSWAAVNEVFGNQGK
jgi:acyl-CoA reductase-like NAD-dependent aldehyde dehydrogenase